MCDHPPVWPSLDEVYTPDGQSKWSGVTDKHSVFRYESRHRVLNVLPWLVSGNARPGPGMNPEQTLKQYYTAGWMESGKSKPLRLMLMCRTMFTAALVDMESGLSEPTRWRRPKRECNGSLWIKYMEEHTESVQTCAYNVCKTAHYAKQRCVKQPCVIRRPEA